MKYRDALIVRRRWNLIKFVNFFLVVILVGCSVLPEDESDSQTTSIVNPVDPENPVIPVPLNNKKVIANWDVIPYQKFNSIFKVGVVAFDGSGVNVEFYVNSNLLTTVKTPSYNSRTKVFEYCTELDASDYPDGPITLKFIARADNDSTVDPRSKELVLYANSNGSLTNNNIKYVNPDSGNDYNNDGTASSPYRSIEKAYVEVGDGGTVYLQAGDYQLTNSLAAVDYKYWTTIAADPSVTDPLENVTIRGGCSTSIEGRFKRDLIKWQNLSLYKNEGRADYPFSYILRFEPGHHIWFDDVKIYDAQGSGGAVTGSWSFNSQSAFVYLTDSLITDVLGACGNGAGYEKKGTEFWRNCTIQNIGNDIWRACTDFFAVNIDFNNYLPTSSHCDMLQWAADGTVTDNIILYNIDARFMNAQGFISNGNGAAQNTAIVNVFFESPIDAYLQSSFSEQYHLLLWHCTFYGKVVDINDLATNSEWDIRNNIFYTFSSDSAVEIPDSSVKNNLFSKLVYDQERAFGENAIVGTPVFVYAATMMESYRPIWSVDDSTFNGEGRDYAVNDVVYAMYVEPGFYKCKVAHNSETNPAKYAPGIGTNWTDYWTEVTSVSDYEVNKSFYDYHLQVSSPGYDAGVPLESVPADVDGDLYDSLNPSLGCFQ